MVAFTVLLSCTNKSTFVDDKVIIEMNCAKFEGPARFWFTE
jgi:hypothetical protein